LALSGEYRTGKADQVADISALTNRSTFLQSALEEGLRSYISVPLVSRGEVIGALNIWSDLPGVFTDTHVDIAYEVAYELAIGMQNARLLEEVSTGREELQSLSRRLLEIQENERRHIARELHDEVGQVLTAVQMNIETLKQSPQGRKMEARLAESIDLVERVLQQVRNLSLDLRPSLLDDLGLVSALMWYVERQSERPGFDVQFAFDPLQTRLPSDIETACFRIAQEAMTNILRHTQATQVQIELRQHGEELELTIRDNGRGFNVRAARNSAAGGKSMGLLSMQERAELLGGRLTIESKPGEGTLVRATLPIRSDTRTIA
jgi:signal transduction histidine kinase